MAQYHCDEGKDSVLHDSGPYGNNIALHNVTWTAGKAGSALVFNGTNSYGSVPAPAGTSLDFGTGDFSVALWINTTSPSNAGHKENILSKGDPFNTGVTLSIEHGITYACVGSTGLNGFSWTVKPVNDGAWHFYVCVRKSGIVSVFNDTSLVVSYSWQGNVTVASTLFIGRHGNSAGEYYNGKLDEITLYSRALSQSEIRANFQSVTTSGLPVLVPIASPTDNRLPTFAWHPVPSVHSYTITIDTSRQFVSPLVHIPVSDTSFVPFTPLPLDTIYWYVSCNDSLARKSVVNTVVIVPKDPFPTVLIPVTPDPTIQKRPRLAWHKVPNAGQYTLLVDDNITFASPLVSVQLTDTSFLPLSDLPLGAIFWKVKADTSIRFSATSSFFIQPDSIPLLYRFNGASVAATRPKFRWHPVVGAVSYILQVDTVFGFSDPVYIMPTSDTAFAPLIDLTPGAAYFWRVSCSKNAALFSPADTVRIDKPVSTLPENGIRNSATQSIKIIDKGLGSIAVRMSGASRHVAVAVQSISGRSLFLSEWTNRSFVDVPLQTKLHTGIYVVRVVADGKVFSSKVFVNR